MKSLAFGSLLAVAVIGAVSSAPAPEKSSELDAWIERANRSESMTATASDGSRFEIKPVANWRDFYPAAD
jgi:hypothetical protein